MTNYSIDQKRRGGNVTAALKRRVTDDCYRRVLAGTAMPSEIKIALADAKRNWKRLRGIAVHMGITNIDEIDAASFDLMVTRAEEAFLEHRTPANKQRWDDISQIHTAVWYRDFIVKHNS